MSETTTGRIRLSVPEFHGLWQYGHTFGADLHTASYCENAQTRQGILRPMAPCTLLPGQMPCPIRTLARLHRRWHTADDQHDVLVAASGGNLYWMLPGGDSWTQIPLPQGTCQSNAWSCVTYEMNPEGSDAPVDVLLMSNPLDGMICIRGDTMTAAQVETPKKFGVIARHAERIWGGAITGDPDMLAYSAPFDPFDCAQNDESPEDGAGDVLQPSWDGDSFTALTSFGDQLMAMKRTRVWRVLGANPGEYVFREQYGGGAPYAGTVAVDGTRILMMGPEGLLCYDGESVSPFRQDAACWVFERLNPFAADQARACLWRDTYYLALPLDNSSVNNAVLCYNTREDTFLLRTDVQVESFLPTEDSLYFTSASTPGRVWLWQEDCWTAGEAQPMRWVGPWCDLGRKDLVKKGFTLYLTPESRQPVLLRLTLETERRARVHVLLVPGTEGESPQRRVRFAGQGRRFRLTVESDGTAPWRMAGGIQLDLDVESEARP